MSNVIDKFDYFFEKKHNRLKAAFWEGAPHRSGNIEWSKKKREEWKKKRVDANQS
jgi:hypothetical protein